jgi:Fur family ferric uptake transcriptional regulator
VILDELRAVVSHPTAGELHEIVRKRLPHVSLGTVYRNLDLLAQQGAIKKLDYAGGEARYDGNLSHHDHLRCIHCGRVDDLMIPPLELLQPEGNHLRGYELLGHRLEFIGLCPRCRQEAVTQKAPVVGDSL